MILRFNEDDVEEFGLLSGYLHDAIGSWDETSYDRDAGTFRVDVDRPRHEAPIRRRFLGLLPVTSYQKVPAALMVRRVVDVVIEPPKRRARGSLPISHLEWNGTTLSILFEGADIVVEVEAFDPIELRDVGPPSVKPKSHRVGMMALDPMVAELERRRVDI